MTPGKRMKNGATYLQAENAYLKAMQADLLCWEKSARSWRKNEIHPEPESADTASLTLLKAAGWPDTLYYQLSLPEARQLLDVKQS
ncbi:hypothetical protein LAD67_11620 [Escherichia coli]|nr:hypothetical protein [Escherichia coli]